MGVDLRRISEVWLWSWDGVRWRDRFFARVWNICFEFGILFWRASVVVVDWIGGEIECWVMWWSVLSDCRCL